MKIPPNPRTMDRYPVILAATSGRLSGVDVFSFNLVRGLNRAGLPAEIVRTMPFGHAPDPLPFPADIRASDLPVRRKESWSVRWKAMISYLEDRSPCIYIPNYDWDHSCVSPVLSDAVGIVGIVHSDDPVHYEHVNRLGKYWNKIVAVSPTIARKVLDQNKEFASKLVVIPYGIDVPAQIPEKQSGINNTLKIVYAGRIVQEQKRVMDIPRILDILAARGVPFAMTVVGGGADEQEFLRACAPHLEAGRLDFKGILANHEVLDLFERSDVFILTSAYEGLPVSLLEAMGRGCVPVVTAIESGVPDVITDGANGFTLGIGDISAFADRLESLQRDPPAPAHIGFRAYETIKNGEYTVERMSEHYRSVFEELWGEVRAGTYRRPAGRILAPKYLVLRSYIPGFIKAIVAFLIRAGKRLWRRIQNSPKARD